MAKNFHLQADCGTTAMGIMPHSDVARALELVLGLDVPFWPQLPHVSYYEDMYVQTSQNFPGIVIDLEAQKIKFSNTKFAEELVDYSQKMADPEIFVLGEKYSSVFHKFLSSDLKGYAAVRGQVTGPVSFGFKVTDEEMKPIIYNDEVRALLFDFIQRKVNAQYWQLKEKNENVFVWVDEPGLGWVFSGLSGYSDIQTRQEYQSFLSGFEGPRALHLCASVNLPYLLSLGIEILSFDAYQIEFMPRAYASAVADFIESGGIICWGIVPTDGESLGRETPETLSDRLQDYWEVVSSESGLPTKQIARQALIAPARCCLKSSGKIDNDAACTADISSTTEERIVEQAFAYLKLISTALKDKFKLS